MITLFFSFYSESKPEYYFIIAFPALLTLITSVASNFFERHIYFFVSLGFIFSFWTVAQSSPGGDFNLQNQLKLVSEVEKIARKNGSSNLNISYDIDPLKYDTSGLKYLLKKVSLGVTKESPVLHITYPNTLSLDDVVKVDKIALWEDT